MFKGKLFKIFKIVPKIKQWVLYICHYRKFIRKNLMLSTLDTFYFKMQLWSMKPEMNKTKFTDLSQRHCTNCNTQKKSF